ncbi:MAG: type II secretion system F family protein [Beijerinckiaceae bacterium]
MNLDILALAFLAAVSVGGIFYVFVYPYLSGEAKAEKRREALTATAVQRKAGERLAEVTANRKKAVSDSLKELEDRENANRRVTLADMIGRAGLSITTQQFYMFSAAAAAGLALLTLVFTGNLIATGLAAIIGGLGLPRWFLGFLRKRRVAKFILEFPNAIDIIVRGIKSGLPLADCIRIIAAEAQEPLRSEFRAIVEAQTLGLSIGDACARLFKRMPISEANFFVIVIQIQQKAGGNLSEALGNLSRVLRDRKRMKDKVKALSMEAKASAWIIGALPIIVGVLVQLSSPGFIAPLFTTQMGHIMLVGSAFWMLCGIVVMKQMINFDI